MNYPSELNKDLSHFLSLEVGISPELCFSGPDASENHPGAFKTPKAQDVARPINSGSLRRDPSISISRVPWVITAFSLG